MWNVALKQQSLLDKANVLLEWIRHCLLYPIRLARRETSGTCGKPDQSSTLLAELVVAEGRERLNVGVGGFDSLSEKRPWLRQ